MLACALQSGKPLLRDGHRRPTLLLRVVRPDAVLFAGLDCLHLVVRAQCWSAGRSADQSFSGGDFPAATLEPVRRWTMPFFSS